jgi:mannose-1-phosphate guanylyltransferase
MRKFYPVIMAGGTGSRLWPLSRELYPKQFLKLDGDMTMLQNTIERLSGISHENPVVICNEDHRFIVAEQLKIINKLTKNIILEPVGRNTAPAIALAALTVNQTCNETINSAISDKDEDPLLLVLAADHVITDSESFQRSILNAIPYAEEGKLVTFGIVPTGPEIGYGYIRSGSAIKQCSQENEILAYAVDQFVEKPNVETAIEYLRSGNYYWNSGMFLFRASRYLEELSKFRPDILNSCVTAVGEINPDLDFVRIDTDAFVNCPSESVDYAVMESTKDAVVVPMNAGWSDVGSWSSLWEISDKDSEGNVFSGDVITHRSNNNYIYAESALVTTVGIDDLVIIQTKDAVLVSRRDRVQDVKQIVEKIKSAGRKEHHLHREVYRPWGKYDSIDSGDRYQVKRISVKPGEGLSLQMHHHRAEHWVVVAGTAKVTRGDEVILLSENESIYIPLGEIHSLENPGKIPLDLIEVRSGSYLEEDDIIRLKDRYGRI